LDFHGLALRAGDFGLEELARQPVP
jgi:hypothetical protein